MDSDATVTEAYNSTTRYLLVVPGQLPTLRASVQGPSIFAQTLCCESQPGEVSHLGLRGIDDGTSVGDHWPWAQILQDPWVILNNMCKGVEHDVRTAFDGLFLGTCLNWEHRHISAGRYQEELGLCRLGLACGLWPPGLSGEFPVSEPGL